MTIQKLIEICKELCLKNDVQHHFDINGKNVIVKFSKNNNGKIYFISTEIDFSKKLDYKSNTDCKNFMEYLINKLLIDSEV